MSNRSKNFVLMCCLYLFSQVVFASNFVVSSGPGFIVLPDKRNQSKLLPAGIISLAQEQRKYVSYELGLLNTYRNADSDGYDTDSEGTFHEVEGIYRHNDLVFAIGNELGNLDSKSTNNSASPTQYKFDSDFNYFQTAFGYTMDNVMFGASLKNIKSKTVLSTTEYKSADSQIGLGVGFKKDQAVFSYQPLFNKEKDKSENLELSYVSHVFSFGYFWNENIQAEVNLAFEPSKVAANSTDSIRNSKSTDLLFNILYQKNNYELYGFLNYGKSKAPVTINLSASEATSLVVGVAPEMKFHENFYALFKPYYEREVSDEDGKETLDESTNYQLSLGLRKDNFDISAGYQLSLNNDEDYNSNDVLEKTKSQSNNFNLAFLWKF
jgi:hypothetical protein